MKTMLLFFVACLFLVNSEAQRFINRWQKVYGGKGTEKLSAAIVTSDGGFILSGHSNSDKFGSKKENANQGSNDYWIVKINAQGTVQWSKTIGGNGDDINPTVLQTKDGGYFVGGTSVSDISVNKTIASRDSSYDYWIVKLDAAGNILWDNTFGGIAAETMHSLAEGSNYYMAAGSSWSNKGFGKSEDNIGDLAWADFWMIKMTTGGTLIWNYVYGGGNQDQLTSLQICKDGGCYVGGYSYSPRGGKKAPATLGNCDYYVTKTDATGTQLWDYAYGGTFSDYMTDAKQTSDDGFIIGGYSNSPVIKSKTAPFLGGTDYWIVKTNKTGVQNWDKTFGGSKNDFLISVQQTADKGYLLGGYSNSGISPTKSEASRGYDYWVVKTDSLGNKQWDKTLGGSGDDTLCAALEISPGEYLLAGTSSSPKSGNKTLPTIGNTGKSDYWLVRFAVMGSAGKTADEKSSPASMASLNPGRNTTYTRLQVTLSPNPVSDELMVSYANADVNNNTLSLLSPEGILLEHSTVRNSSGTLRIDVTKYPAGVYYLSLSAGTKTVVRKFVKK